MPQNLFNNNDFFGCAISMMNWDVYKTGTPDQQESTQQARAAFNAEMLNAFQKHIAEAERLTAIGNSLELQHNDLKQRHSDLQQQNEHLNNQAQVAAASAN